MNAHLDLTETIRTIIAHLAIVIAGCMLIAKPGFGEVAPLDTDARQIQALVEAGVPLDVAQQAVGDGEGALLASMISIVTVHDIAIIVGALPFPTASYAAEVTEYSANLGLKALPPRLFPPASRSIDPTVGDGTAYTADGCGIEFQLLSPQAGYSNLFGIANIGDPYTQFDPFRIYRFRNYHDPDDPDTRWGFLRAPHVYHANTGVGIEVSTPGKVRRYDPLTDSLGDPYTPIDPGAEGPQQVYLPIGTHSIEWRATTQIETLGDIAVPGVLLLFNTLSELKNLYGGAKAARQAKASGFGSGVADEALDPAGAKRLSDGILKFEDVWKKAFEARQARKPTAAQKVIRKIREKLRDIIKELVKGALKDLLIELGKAGINSIDGDTKYAAQVVVGNKVADIIEDIWEVYKERYAPPEIVTKSATNYTVSTRFVIDTLDDNVIPIIRQTLTKRGTGTLKALMTIDTAETTKYQAITVLDSVPPTIELDSAPVIIEATDFGGTRTSRSYSRLLALAEAASSDNCGRTPELILAAPDFLDLGTHQITWTAKDRGPNPDDGKDYAPTATQNILVRDTQPPLLLAPPSKVILASADVDLASAGIGDAAAIDLVDVQPEVTNDAPAVFSANSRTAVHWVATDGSGNATSPASQLITIKDTNTAPTANDATASTLTAEPVDIRLTANDVDELDGRFDPLWFKIESQPRRGEFIAPLYPFFIDDYRTRPGDGLGQDYDPSTDVGTYIRARYCPTSLPADQRIPPRDFVYDARFVHVTDDGIRYVLDSFFECDGSSDELLTFQRFSQWGPRGDYQGQVQLGTNAEDAPTDDAFRVDRDGFLYYNTLISAGSSSELRLHQCPLDFQGRTDLTAAQICDKPPFVGYRFDGSSTQNGELDAASMIYSRVDSDRDIAYVVDGSSILAFELLDTGGTRFIGELGPKDDQGTVLATWFGRITSLEVGSDGALYANDMLWHRIHKLAATTVDEQGQYVLGEYVGWAGKCTGSANNSCTVDPAQPELGHSRGYSCTYAADSCTVAPADRAGARQGQFDTPRYIAIDPNDVLYVADYGNARIQRFSPDGTFAGEAVSDGSGINKGDRPSFVLGNMGPPASVAVNSSQFFVVDRDEQFVHIFGTLPFKDITDNAATVTYVSDQDYPNPDVAADDSFTFSVSDGLAQSTPATVTVTVSRNFRPPEVPEQTIDVDEDATVDFTLPAHDPDGIIGKDFLGLDTLTYKLTRWPEHGTLSGYGDSWTYKPYADFYGEDSLSFIVNDGVYDSNEGTLTFDVAPINDPPVVTVDIPARVALGFPTQISSTFSDDRLDVISTAVPDEFSDGYAGTIDWGDDTTDITGGFMNDNGDVSTEGVIVVAPPNDKTEGRTFGEHTFEQAGERTISVCVTDVGALQGCDSVNVNVEPLVSIGVAGIFYNSPLPDGELTLQEIPDATPFTVELMITNGMPSVGAGLPAENVTLDLTLPDRLGVADLAIDQGNCARDDQEVNCTIGTMDPGAEVTLTMTAIGPGTLIYDEDRDFSATLTTSSDALDPEVGMFATVTVIADTTDTDGDGMSDKFEIANLLVPTVNDAAGDLDRDGLSNLDEYLQGTSPRDADTDNDGATDGAEVAAGTNPLLDDIPPQLTIPADIQVNATGVLTDVDLGTATAVDYKDGTVEIEPNNPGPFRSGPNVVTWTATDSSGNRNEAYQLVNVVPMVNFQVDQTVPEGVTARAHVELIGPAVNYPVIVPYEVSGTASNPSDHDAVSGQAVIDSGLSTDIEIDIVKDQSDEPDETVVLTMGAPTNAVSGGQTTHTITISEINRPPKVAIDVEQQGRRTTTVVSAAGLIGLIADVRDDPAQEQSYDWSASDPALIDPVAVNDPAYLLDPSGLSAGLYDMRVAVTDDGVPAARTDASSLLNVATEPLMLSSSNDSDGDGVDDATEGPDDSDGDRIPDYLDNVVNSNLLRLAADGRMLETIPGLTLRLGARAFAQGSAYASVEEAGLGTDAEYGYGSNVADFEVTNLDSGAFTQVVLPLKIAVSGDAAFRTFVDGQWQDFIETAGDFISSAPGTDGACPPPGAPAFTPGLAPSDGCLQLTLTDGGANDLDGVTDGVVRILGGLASPVSAGISEVPQSDNVLAGDGEAVMVRTRLHSDSGDVVLNSLTLQATGTADDTHIDNVMLIHDIDRDGEWGADDIVLSSGQFTEDDGTLTLTLDQPLDVPVGDTGLLVVYVFGPID
jgi:hypothetical protein